MLTVCFGPKRRYSAVRAGHPAIHAPHLTKHVAFPRVSAPRQKIEMRRRFDAAATTICGVNLKRFLKEKEDRQV